MKATGFKTKIAAEEELLESEGKREDPRPNLMVKGVKKPSKLEESDNTTNNKEKTNRKKTFSYWRLIIYQVLPYMI